MRTKRDDILEAAAIIFARKGVDGASVPQILKQANASAGAMYSYFESKKELADEVFRQADDAIYRVLWHQFPHHVAPREQFHVLWARYFSLMGEEFLHLAILSLLDLRWDREASEHDRLLHELCKVWRSSAPEEIGLGEMAMVSLIKGLISHLLTSRLLGSEEKEDMVLDPDLWDELEVALWHAFAAPH